MFRWVYFRFLSFFIDMIRKGTEEQREKVTS